MFLAFFENSFLQMALWACLLASIASGVIGSFVVVQRISFIAGSISHSILGGMGFFLWLQKTYDIAWLSPIWGAFISAIGAAMLLGWVQLNYRERQDSVIAAIWTTGMAIGIIFISLTPGTNVELMHYLFGNLLWIDSSDLFRLAGLNGIILISTLVFYKKFLALCFDTEQAKLQGVKVKGLYLFLLSLIAISIVLLMQVVGTILVMAILTLPPTLAALFTERLSRMMALGTLFSILFCISGLLGSALFNWPPAATIALCAAFGYLILLPLKKKKIFFTKKTKISRR